MTQLNSFGAAATLRSGSTGYRIFRLDALEKRGLSQVARLPISIKILLENMLRLEDGQTVKAADVEAVASGNAGAREISFMPARVCIVPKRKPCSRLRRITMRFPRRRLRRQRR